MKLARGAPLTPAPDCAHTVRMAREPHNTRYPPDLWAQAAAIADAEGVTMTDVLCDGLARYIAEHTTTREAS